MTSLRTRRTSRRDLIRRLAGVTLALAAFDVRATEPALVSLDEAARRLTAGGFVMMMRHAQTEAGVGDPPGYRLDDCASQRNLSAAGRAQARATGAGLRASGVRIARVRSSAWCRCRDTAELAFGRHEVWPVLNSFFDRATAGPEQTRDLEIFAKTVQPPDNTMLVTHQVNISAAFGAWTSPGEIVAGRWTEGRLRAEFRFRADVTPGATALNGVVPIRWTDSGR
jgi:phosphohistidine phosphatase SixA